MEEQINLINGDCLEVMKDIADGSIDAIIADLLKYGVSPRIYIVNSRISLGHFPIKNNG